MSSILLVLLACLVSGLIATPAFAGTAEEVNVLPTVDALNRSESPLSNGGKWGALSWDTSVSSHNTGQDTASGWGPYDAFSTVNGAYWTPATFNDVSGDAATVTMNTSPGNVERYVSLWLDMPSPASAKTGYQLRWTMTNVASNTYSVTLSKWSAATQTVLASNASVTIAPGTTLAISDTGATVSAWQNSGGTFSSLLSVTDSTFSGGYAGIEGSGNISRSSNFKAGLLVGPAIGTTSVLDNLERNEHPFPSGSKWSKTSWAESVGGAWGSPYRGYGGSGLSGAYWNPGSFSDGGETVLSAATVGTGAPYAGEYLAVWLDMPSPGSERSGYEARFTGTNGAATAYQVELSKWVAGTRTVLASTSGFSLPVGTTIALTETAGGTLALWSGSGASMTPVLKGSDSTYTGGYASLEVKGGAGTLYNFRAGQVFNQPPDTSITAGPKGDVLPNVAFSFSSNKTGTSFECSLDGAAYGACTSPKSYSGLSEGGHVFKVRAVGSGGKDETPAERAFQVIAPAKATSKVAVLDNLERSEVPLANGKWSTTSWTSGIGGVWIGGYRGFGSGGGLEGAYWNPATFSDGGESQLIAATVGTGATPVGQYLGLWLDMPNPGSERTGYEARFTGTNGTATAYQVELSKWVASTRTVLASTSGFSLPVGTTIALSETAGGTITLWTGTSSSMTQTLTASDSTYTSGYAGLEVNGGAGTLYNFRAGALDLTAPNTTIQSGPSGVVLPEGVSFAFTAGETGATFECSLDGAAYVVCSSPQPYPGLVSGSSHTFRVRAVDAVGNQDETPAERSFRVVLPPGVTTNAASGVKSSEATLQASVNPNGAETTYQFEYGTTTSYGSKAPATAQSLGTGSTAVEAGQAITGLTTATVYHYRVAATNAAGTSHGEDRTFTTTVAPAAVTEAATSPTATSATLNATVNPKGAETTYQFEYGKTIAYGSKIPIAPKAIGGGTGSVAVSETPTGLTEGTTYHYRVAATNEVGTTYGADHTLMTLQLPTVTTEPATGVEGTEPAVHATVNPNGQPTTYQFEYGKTTSYGYTGPGGGGSSGNGTQLTAASEVLEQLEPNTTYHYRVLATSQAGSVAGLDRTFTTGEAAGSEELWNHNKTTGQEGVFTSSVGGQGVGGSEIVPSVDLMFGGGHEEQPAEMEAIHRMGASMLRLNLAPDSDPQRLQSIFELARKQNVVILPCLYGGAGMPDGHEFPDVSHRKAYVEWVENIVAKYGPTGSFWGGNTTKAPSMWEVWNEPNVALNSPQKKVNPEEYGRFLIEVSEAITRGSTGKARAMVGGLLNINAEGTSEEVEMRPEVFLEKMSLVPNVDKFYAALSLHPYVFKAKNGLNHAPRGTKEVEEVARRVTGQIKLAREALNKHNGSTKQIWITELGWPLRVVEDSHHEGIECSATVKCQQIQGELINYTFDRIKEKATEFGVPAIFYFNDRDTYPENADKAGIAREWAYYCGLRTGGNYVIDPEKGSAKQPLEVEGAGRFRKAAYAFEAEAGVPNWPHKASTHTQGAAPQLHSVSMSGRVNPDGLPAKLFFRYGTTSGYGKSTTPRDAGFEQEVEVQGEASGLQQGTTYHYQAVSINENGEEEEGEDRTFTTPPMPTEAFLTLDGTANGTPGTASVSGNVQRNGVGISGTVNVNFQKLVSGTWQTMSTAQRTLSSGHYEVVKWGVGVGQWRVRAVFPEQGDYAQSESNYHEFSIQPVPSETFLTLDGTANGTPGTASVSGNVLHNGAGVPGYANVNFEKWNGSTWQTMSSAQRVLSNGHYEVVGWGVGVGSWRVRAVFPEQGDYAQSESSYHEFSISPVPTESFLTVNQVVKGKPGNVSVSGNVLHNGAGVPGYANVNFEKWNGSAWQTMSTAQPGLSNGHYEVLNWGVGAGSWRVRVVFPEQGEYLGSMSEYHEFTI